MFSSRRTRSALRTVRLRRLQSRTPLLGLSPHVARPPGLAAPGEADCSRHAVGLIGPPMRDQQTLGRAPGQPRRALLGRFAREMPGRPPASGTMVQFGTVGPFDSRPHCSPKAGDLGFRRPAAGCTRPGGRLPLPSPPGLSGVGIDRASASTHVLAKALPHRRTDGRVPRGFQTQRSLAVLVVIVVGESGVEMALCRGSGGHCAPSRQAAEPTSLERDPGRVFRC